MASTDPLWVVCVSGPASKRHAAEVALETARIPLLPDDHHAQMDWPVKLTPLPSGKTPKDPQAFIAVAHDDIDQVVAAVARHGYVLRVHHEMPPEPEPDPVAALVATVAELQTEVAALRERVN